MSIREDLQVVNEFETSELIDVPVGTLRNWRSEKKGPRFIKYPNGTVRYRLRDLAQFQEERAVGTETRVAV